MVMDTGDIIRAHAAKIGELTSDLIVAHAQIAHLQEIIRDLKEPTDGVRDDDEA